MAFAFLFVSMVDAGLASTGIENIAVVALFMQFKLAALTGTTHGLVAETY